MVLCDYYVYELIWHDYGFQISLLWSFLYLCSDMKGMCYDDILGDGNALYEEWYWAPCDSEHDSSCWYDGEQ